MFKNLLLFFTSLFDSSSNPPLAVHDLDAIYHVLLENHPGAYNKEDPHFKPHLNKQYKTTRKKLLSCPVERQETCLLEFIASFNDNHLRISNKNQIQQRQHTEANALLKCENIKNHVLWVTLPTFMLNDLQKNDLQKIVKKMPAWKNDKIIVFDLRGNRGGNSMYGSMIIDALFGKEYANYRRDITRHNQSVDWRASIDNIEHMQSLYKELQDEWIKNVIKGMKKSLSKNLPYYEVKNTCSLYEKIPTHTVNSKIIVITDKFNASAALNFIDDLKMMEFPVTLIGEITKADRLYMEVRAVELPSKKLTLYFPIKVYRNRPRKDNEPYYPDIKTDIKDTNQLLNLIENL